MTRFDDVRELLRDPRLSSDLRHARWWRWVERLQLSAGRTRAELDEPSLILSDAPRHTRLRQLVNKAFTPDSIRALTPSIERIAHELLDRMPKEGVVDVMEHLACPLPLLVIAELLGVPIEDRDRFREWADESAGATGTFALDAIRRSVAAEHQIQSYLMRIIDQRRQDPRDDLVTRLIQAEEEGDRLSIQEMLSLHTLLLVAGNATTRGLISLGLLALLRNPDQLERVRRHPDSLEEGINELARYDSAVQLASRIATEDFELHGRRIRRGQMISMLIGAANRDPSRFDNPDRLDLGRDNRQFLVFGHGVHYCLGHFLARVEAKVVLRALLSRYPHIALADEPPIWGQSWVLRSLARLPVRLEP